MVPFISFRRYASLLAIALSSIGLAIDLAADEPPKLQRWVYASINFLVPSEVERCEAILERSHNAGYTHCLITDSKFGRLPEMDARYFKHLERIKATATKFDIELVPALFPIGYSNSILSQNPNLADGLPVKAAAFVMRGGQAVFEPDAQASLPSLSDRKQWGFIDETFVTDENAVRATNPKEQNCRIMKSLKVTPFRQYHVSLQIKTQDFTSGIEIKALVEKNRNLNYTQPKVASTQDWTTHHITFNSLDHTQINFYIGAWGANGGTLWIREPKIEEAPPINILRRPGTPVTVQKETKTNSKVSWVPLSERTDYEPMIDPKLGSIPYKGEYEPWHEPVNLTLKQSLPEGTRLHVSYFHPHIIHTEQVCGCVTEPEFMDRLKQQAKDLHAIFPSHGKMMSHDEWRLFGWDESFQALKQTPGEVAAQNVRQCFEILRSLQPDAKVYVWSDMFDPYHNAKPEYYLVNGSLVNSWDGLNKSITIMNWNSGHPSESLPFFAERGHTQILAGYYDDKVAKIQPWLKVVRDRKIPGVIGVMYTTWHNRYDDLEAFASELDKWESITRSK